MVTPSGKFNIFISWSYICTPLILVSMKIENCINENCKYFIAALIYNNIESRHPKWTHPNLMVKRLDKDNIYFNFRLDTGITNCNDMDEFVWVTKHMKNWESKISIHPVKKESKEMTANCLLSVLDISYVTYFG